MIHVSSYDCRNFKMKRTAQALLAVVALARLSKTMAAAGQSRNDAIPTHYVPPRLKGSMLLRSLSYCIVPVLLLIGPPAKGRGEDPSPTAASKAASTAKVADDPAAVEAFIKAGRYRYCQRDKDGNVTFVDWNWPCRFETPATHQLRLQCLENLKGFPNLCTIKVHTDNPNEELGYIGGLTKLETLEVHNTELIDSGLSAIQGMVGLKRLSLDGNYKLTDTSLEYLASLKSLEDLDLSHTSVRGTGLGWLKGLKNLKRLDLSGTKLGNAQMVEVTAFASLEELNLSATNITSGYSGELSCLTRLRKLSLNGTLIGDSRLADLAAITSLEELDLSSTKVTSQSLHELSRLTRLRTLKLCGTEGTRSGAEDLKKALPNLKISLPATGYIPEPRRRSDP